MPMGDQDLFQLIRSSTIETVDDVILVLRGLDGELANDDGLKWFNLLYLKVTEAVGTQQRTISMTTRLTGAFAKPAKPLGPMVRFPSD